MCSGCTVDLISNPLVQVCCINLHVVDVNVDIPWGKVPVVSQDLGSVESALSFLKFIVHAHGFEIRDDALNANSVCVRASGLLSSLWSTSLWWLFLVQ